MEGTRIDKKALYLISSGVYIVSTGYDGCINGQIVNTAMQISGQPDICIATALHRDNYTTELVQKSGVFSLAILEEDVPLPFIGNFGFRCGREHDKFSHCDYELYEKNFPLVKDHTLAALCADVIGVQEVKTHLLFIGQVKYTEVFKRGTPLTYKVYHELKKGKSPKTAPTYVFNDES